MSYTTKNDKVYNSWRKMHIRCYDTSYHSYHRYGGRGIIVCDRWHEYIRFKEDMWEDWFEGATVDRSDNNGNYDPENCIWKTKKANSKPLKYPLTDILALYNSGLKQKEIGAIYNLPQDRISKLLKRARNG
jgi:hypothetical protein